MNGIPLCRIEDIPDGDTKSYLIDEADRSVRVFAVRCGDTVRVYENACPHTGAPLNMLPDRFLNEDGSLIVCASHGALFRIEDGLCLQGPCQGDHLTARPLDVRDGLVYLRDQPET